MVVKILSTACKEVFKNQRITSSSLVRIISLDEVVYIIFSGKKSVSANPTFSSFKLLKAEVVVAAMNKRFHHDTITVYKVLSIAVCAKLYISPAVLLQRCAKDFV